MTMKRENALGNVIITPDAVASLTAAAVKQCFGVVGMANKSFIKDSFVELLKGKNFSRGVFVRKSDKGIELDVYIILCYGVKVTEVTKEVQRKVKYELENAFDVKFASVNIFVQGVRNMD